MKYTLLLLMTPGMSLEKWSNLGQLSRELWVYKELCDKADFDLIIYSYGRNDEPFLQHFPNATVLTMYSWIPKRIPFRLQNVIYNLSSLIIYRQYFKKVRLSKTNQFSASKFGMLLKFFFGIPLVVRMGFYHSHFKKLSVTKRFIEKAVFRSSDLILTTSTEAAAFISNAYCIPSEKIKSICNSIDLDKFTPVMIPKEYDILFVGRLEKVKNIKLIIEVVQEVKLRTLIIGKGSLSPLVKKAVEESSLIQWKERVDNIDLPQYYNKSKCFLILSEHEGNPKALLEAMACGIPSVATNVPGIRECIQDGFNGVLVEADSQLIADKIRSLCNDDTQLSHLGNNARDWVQVNGDFNKNITNEVSFYFTLFNN